MAADDNGEEAELSTKISHMNLSWVNFRRHGRNNNNGKPSRKSLANVPLNALGISKNEKYTYKDTMKDRHRMRKQVGMTNRWRLPEPLGSDLLGTSQALRAVVTPLNTTMQKIISADSQHISVNVDPNEPYSFRPIPACSTNTSAETKRLRKVPKLPRGPKNLFYCYTKKAKAVEDYTWKNYDVLLKCLNVSWELHRDFICKSPVLNQLLQHSLDHARHQGHRQGAFSAPKRQAWKCNAAAQASRSSCSQDNSLKEERAVSAPSEQYSAPDTRLPSSSSRCRSSTSLFGGAVSMVPRFDKAIVIQLDIDDPMVTKNGLAVALGNLYYEELSIDPKELPHTFAAAHALELEDLKERPVSLFTARQDGSTNNMFSRSKAFAVISDVLMSAVAHDRCAEVMCHTISTATVALFHKTAALYNLEEISIFCERWLELNLIPFLSKEIQLGEIPQSLIEKTVSSKNLFTENEFAIYRTLCYWLFLYLNPNCSAFPSIGSIVAYFNCLCRDGPYLETDQGSSFTSLFWSIRFQGITDTNHIHMIKTMNLIPQIWLVDLLCQHYSALQCGGDMCSIHNFESGSIRQGILIEKGKSYDSEVMSIYGFHFNLKVVYWDKRYTLYIQRLKPTDPALSFRECERHTFSLRAERTVTYCITVQTYNCGRREIKTTGILKGTFRQGTYTSKSKELQVEGETFPLYCTFSILLPLS